MLSMARYGTSEEQVMGRRRIVFALLAMPLVVLPLVGVARAGVSALGSSPPIDLTNAYFVSQCTFSHASNDDPIRLPRKPGLSHNHSFFGNVSTDAMSTAKTLRTAESTCDRDGDRAAYWIPTLYGPTGQIFPTGAEIYYRRVTSDEVRPFPQGFELVAGNQFSRVPQRARITSWSCVPASTGRATAAPSVCPSGSHPELRVSFPSCWDGRLTGANNTRDVAYAVGTSCPARYPVSLPRLEMIFRYPALTSMRGIALASGGGYSAHADFFNAWAQPQLRQLIDLCLNEMRGCGRLPPRETPGVPTPGTD